MSQEQDEVRRRVSARLIEMTPARLGLSYWILASPLILFLGWVWIDLFAALTPIPWPWLDFVLAMLIFLATILPLGYGAHRLVAANPRLFQNAGWNIEPLEPVTAAEQYTVRYVYDERRPQPFNVDTFLARSAQGWVYLEIVAIFVGAILMIPLFFSAVEFGFGSG